MINYKAILQYNGANYAGFCKQNSESTIESELEKALAVLFKKTPKINVAGRTDAGVHALGQVINFKATSDLALTRLRYSLNSILPDDIKISRLSVQDSSFDARRSALARQYVYYLLNRRYPSVVHNSFCYHYPRPLDIGLMNEASRFLLGAHNFEAFSAANGTSKNFIRHIHLFKIKKKSDFFDVDDEDMIKITIKANSFLYRMVRNMVGTLIEVGMGNIKPSFVKTILDGQDRKKAGPTAQAQGLFLEKVYYEG